MNDNDPFEQRLRRQPLRHVPCAWRDEIIIAADVNRRSAATQPVFEKQAELLAGWRCLFARLPLAWASLAALWIVLIGLNLMMPGPVVRMTAQTVPSDRMASLATLNMQSADLEAWDVQISPAPAPASARKTPAVPLRPRSERRRGVDFGETRSDYFSNIIT